MELSWESSQSMMKSFRGSEGDGNGALGRSTLFDFVSFRLVSNFKCGKEKSYFPLQKSPCIKLPFSLSSSSFVFFATLSNTPLLTSSISGKFSTVATKAV